MLLRLAFLSLLPVLVGTSRAEPSSEQGPPNKEPPAKKTAPDREGKLREGDIAPDFSLKDQAGKTTTLSDLKGKPVLLYFGSCT